MEGYKEEHLEAFEIVSNVINDVDITVWRSHYSGSK